MAKGYSKNLRERVVSIVEESDSAREAARRLNVGASTAIRWIERWTTTGSVEAKPGTGHSCSPLNKHEQWLLDLIAAEPDLTLDDIRLRLSGTKKAQGWNELDLALLRSSRDHVQKNTLHAAEQDRPDVAAARAALKTEQPSLKAPRLVFIDETAVTTKMVRRYGRSPRGERLVASGATRSLEDADVHRCLAVDGMTAPNVIDGAMDGQHLFHMSTRFSRRP
jgi:transposase